MHKAIIYLGLGGNIGDTVSLFEKALYQLNAHSHCQLKALAPLYLTPPWGNIDQPWFVNSCCSLETQFAPEELLRFCQSIETQLGRKREKKWAARTIDIDLLASADGQNYRSCALTLPHPFLTERAFVLAPLATLCPQMVVKDKTIAQWCALKKNEEIKKMPAPNSWIKLQKSLL